MGYQFDFFITVLPTERHANASPGGEHVCRVWPSHHHSATGRRVRERSSNRGQLQVAVRPCVPRILHSGMVHNRQEANVSVLLRKSRSKAVV